MTDVMWLCDNCAAELGCFEHPASFDCFYEELTDCEYCGEEDICDQYIVEF